MPASTGRWLGFPLPGEGREHEDDASMENDRRPGEDAAQADHIHFRVDPRTTLAVLTGHRRRFGSTVATLTVDELAAPSRCRGWTVADVLRHLVWVDATMGRLWAGDESPVEGFDPRTTPDESVRADRAVPDEEFQRRYLSSTEAMIVELESADAPGFGRPSLSPAGRVPWWMSVMHLGWDSTVHERDVLAPLGRTVDAVPGEAQLCLGYSLVLASLFDRKGPLNVRIGTTRLRRDGGPVTVEATDAGPDLEGADDGTVVLTGDPVATVDALCGRGSLTDALSGDAAVIGRLDGLARYFAAGGQSPGQVVRARRRR